jgi:transcriptional regulator with XRE-family HTH domain
LAHSGECTTNNNIRQYLDAAGISQREFAGRIEIHESTVSRLIDGLEPGIERARLIAKTLSDALGYTIVIEDVWPAEVPRNEGGVDET